MRKFAILIVLCASGFLISNKIKAQSVQKGNFIIDIDYGFPNLFSSLIKSAYNTSNGTGVSVGAIGPITGKCEYLLSDKVGVGGIISYANSTVKWNAQGSDGLYYDYKVSIPRLRILAAMTFHFATGDKVDPFFCVGAGYSNYQVKMSTADPDYSGSKSISWLFPVALRVGVGVRYFFTENIGANMEIGLGQALIQAGLSMKF